MAKTEPVKSDFGDQTLVTNANGVTFDLNKDYSKEMANYKEGSAEWNALKTQRDAKIASKAYGGTQKDDSGNSRYMDSSYGTSFNENYTADTRYNTSDPLTSTYRAPEEPATPRYDTSALKAQLEGWLSAAQKQQTAKIDYATQQAIAELTRTKADAETTFQEQRDQIAVDEAKAKDNQALYAERRGDRGGIGAAQYDAIMATAAQNRLAVNQAQTKLATDTARQISDLRAQGAYEKADALLALSQQYLSQLISLEQWAAEYNLSVDQFNVSLDQWDKEYKLSVADLTGYYNGAPTFKNQQWQTEVSMTEQANLAEQGWMFLKAGIPPTASQLAAMGMSASDAQNYLTELKVTGGISGGGTSGQYSSTYQAMYDAGITNERDALNYLTTVGGMKTDSQIELAYEMAATYAEMYNNGDFLSVAEKTAKANGTSMDRLNFEDSIGNKLIQNQSATRDGVKKYFVNGVGWLSEQEIVDGLYGNQLDFIFDGKNKNKFTVIGVVSR